MKKNKDRTTSQTEQTISSPAFGGAWISTKTEFDDEIDKKNHQFLHVLEKSRESDRVIVGWKPE